MRITSIVVAAVLACSSAAIAQQQDYGDAQYRPQVAQPGKDVIWVPTPDEVVERMLRLAQTTSNDLVYDLGAGDGKIAIMAAQKFGARSVGVEFNPDMAALGQRNAERAGVAARAKIIRGDIFETNFKDANVVTLFLLPSLNIKLRPTLLEMAPGTRVVAHAFDMDDWKADEITRLDGRTMLLWIVPAKVQGRWRLDHPVHGRPQAFSIDFNQIYQRVDGDVNFEKMRSTLRDPVLSGDNISFSITDPAGARVEFTGKIAGNAMEGVARSGGKEFRWRAARQ